MNESAAASAQEIPKRHRKSPQRRNLLIGIGEGMLSTPWVFLSTPGNFIIAALLTQYFSIDKATYGWIVSLPAWCNASQIVLIPLLARFLTPKDLALGLGWFNIGLWSMFLAGLGFLPVGKDSEVAMFFIIFFLLTSISAAFIGVGWTSWIGDWIPNVVRGTYIGRRNRWLSSVSILFLLLSIGLFSKNNTELWPYQLMIGLAVVTRFSAIIWQHGIRTEKETANLIHSGWVSHVWETMRAPGLLPFILFSAWMSFWLGFIGPFVPVFCYEELLITPAKFTTFVILATITAAMGWVYWGKQADRMGSIPVLCVGVFMWEISNFSWMFLTPQNTWMLYPMWLWGGFFSVAYFMGSFNLLLNLIPDKTKIAGISLNMAITSIAAATASVVAGMLLRHFIEKNGGGIEVYRFGFGLKSTSVLLGLLFLVKIREPRRSSRTTLPGAFSTIRQLLSLNNLGFLSHLPPLRKKKPSSSDDSAGQK